MIFNALVIGCMLFNAYYSYYCDYKEGRVRLAKNLQKISGVAPLNLCKIDQNPDCYYFSDQETQALLVLRKVIEKCNLNFSKIFFNFGKGDLAATYSDKLLFINSELVIRVPQSAQQEYVIGHEFGHMYYKHSQKKNSLEIIVPLCLELVLLLACMQGCTWFYPPAYKDTKTIKSYCADFLIVNSAAFLLAQIRSMAVFLIQRIIWRRYELQADTYAAKKLKDAHSGIRFFNNQDDLAIKYKDYHKLPIKERIVFYWKEYKKHLSKGYIATQAVCLALMPHWSATHPDHACRIQHLKKLRFDSHS